ncbi:GTP 3',8-cyclase MoaA [Dissulfurimicrobium hydrothermale]|uniref:GTP 3',8-cyclase MoaA n=1 Tax=Dissulfurimicrobium hydrothermale TaxID=1750598 RepID=UPI001EDA6EC7|nr:GTP 3',8-cyclase MoaA [Dissulfurimicrobium hydrothermale]UKL14011.1 GTP 3',8-cyclase MoaA [Dissulfurimicrobium hydrothermale]
MNDSSAALSDKHGREITYLRISITDRCNLRCSYCTPRDGQVNWLSHEDILSYEEIERLANAFSGLGVRKIRLTGGEPLVRKGVEGLAGRLIKIPGIKEVCLTTNGILLGDMATPLFDAGVRHINISLDTLKPERFLKITGKDLFQNVWQGIEKAIETRFTKIKLNAVAMKGVNDDEIVDLARLSLELPLEVRFIEFMPVGSATTWEKSRHLNCDAIKEMVERSLGDLIPVSQGKDSGPAMIYRLKGAKGSVGFISPLSRHFCGTCNRVRITPDGRLRLCLFSDNEIDLKGWLRAGISNDELKIFLKEAIAQKPKGIISLKDETPHCTRAMSRIGG